MIKKDTLGKTSAKVLEDAFKCGECLHFKQHAHSGKGKPCVELGVRAVGIAPRTCFTPDVTKLAKNSDQFVQVASMFQAFTPQERRILMALMRNQRARKTHQVGDALYFCVGADYVSNYLKAYVMGHSSSGELLLIGSPDNRKRGQSFTAYLRDSDTLLTVKQWKVKREQLKGQNKIFDPKNRMIKKSSITDNYEPPTIDSVPSSWYDKKEPAKKRRRTDGLSFNVS